MVKNYHGGSKSKKMASKNTTNHNNRNLRVSQDDCEIYAIITEKLGGGHLRAVGVNGNKYMVHVGGKFRNERFNKYDYILIGLRDWQTSSTSSSSSSKKNIMVDLLEVYNDQEKNKLLKINGISWKILIQEDHSNNESHVSNANDFEFSTETETEYNEIQDFILKKDSVTKLGIIQEEEKKEEKEEEFDISFI